MTALKAKTARANGAGPARSWLTQLNLHWVGVGLLALVNLYLLVQMALLWHSAPSRSPEAMAEQRIALKTAEIAAAPLRGLDEKLAKATEGSDIFYRERLPATYSEVAGELGLLTKRQGVRLSRVQYTPATVLAGTQGELIQVRMDATLSGDYRPLMLMLNSLERDRMFFMINTVGLTGQQSGTVNLRMRLTTYLRPTGSPELKSNVPPDVKNTLAGGVPR